MVIMRRHCEAIMNRRQKESLVCSCFMYVRSKLGHHRHCRCHQQVQCRLQKTFSLQWYHNGRDGLSNHQRLHCLLNRLFRRWSKKIPKLRVTGFVRGVYRSPVNSPHKGPVTRKMFPFDDVIMSFGLCWTGERFHRPCDFIWNGRRDLAWIFDSSRVENGYAWVSWALSRKI